KNVFSRPDPTAVTTRLHFDLGGHLRTCPFFGTSLDLFWEERYLRVFTIGNPILEVEKGINGTRSKDEPYSAHSVVVSWIT
ncbi:MAG: hypothetical protein K6U74_18990, partial [Firmicutes bacterium]|nr:hypothetical protein [Bacillota bacterium]